MTILKYYYIKREHGFTPTRPVRIHPTRDRDRCRLLCDEFDKDTLQLLHIYTCFVLYYCKTLAFVLENHIIYTTTAVVAGARGFSSSSVERRLDAGLSCNKLETRGSVPL